MIDVEILRMLQVEFTPLEIREEDLAWDAHHGGRPRRPLPRLRAHDGALPHLLLPAAPVVESDNFERWMKNGGQDAADARAARSPASALEAYEAPPMDDAIRAELEEFVIRRRRELGD